MKSESLMGQPSPYICDEISIIFGESRCQYKAQNFQNHQLFYGQNTGEDQRQSCEDRCEDVENTLQSR